MGELLRDQRQMLEDTEHPAFDANGMPVEEFMLGHMHLVLLTEAMEEDRITERLPLTRRAWDHYQSLLP